MSLSYFTSKSTCNENDQVSYFTTTKIVFQLQFQSIKMTYIRVQRGDIKKHLSFSHPRVKKGLFQHAFQMCAQIQTELATNDFSQGSQTQIDM